MSIHLLGLETSTDACSVALLRDEHLLSVATLWKPRAHAEHLAGMIDEVVRRAGLSPDELDVVAVAAGPGSYTGLRIGVSTAKGLAVATGAAVVGPSTLKALAASVQSYAQPGERLLAVLPSRKHEVYAALYAPATLEPVLPPEAVARADLFDRLTDAVGEASFLVAGPAAPGVVDALASQDRLRLRRAPNPDAYDARWVARLGLEQFRRGDVEDVSVFEPVYLKPFVAKRAGSIFERLPPM